MTQMRLGSGLHLQADIAEHVTKLNDPSRLNALDNSGVLDAAQDDAHDRSVRLASRILGAPVALVSYVDTERQHFKAQVGLCGPAAEDCGTPLTHSFCQYVVSSGKPLMVNDSRKDPILSQNGAVEDLNVIAYLGVPVHAPTGEVLGSFCVIEDKPRDWTADDLEALTDLVHMLETELLLRHTVSEREVILQEMNHRVRNLFSLINGMVRMDRRTATSAGDLADSIGKRLNALNAAHQMIVPVVEAQGGQIQGEPSDLETLMGKLLAPYAGTAHMTLSGDTVAVGPKAAVYMTLTVHELATNAAKYGALSIDGGKLEVEWHVRDGHLDLSWVETGHSWGEIETQGSGFGSKLLTISVEGQLDGTIETIATNDEFRHVLRLPMPRLSH